MAKFETEDRAYFEYRAQFAEKYRHADFWFIADNWPLFAGRVNLARCLAVYDLISRVIDLPGHFCELGCWNGANLVYIAKIVGMLRPLGQGEVFGFDSFEGLTAFAPDKDPVESRRGRGAYKGDPVLLEDVLALYRLQDWVHLVKGRIEETLPRFLEERKDIRFAFLYLDMDLYAPTKAAIDLLYPRLLKGGIMVFDEYNADWPGETLAVHEALGDDVQLHRVPYTRQPTAYLIK